jgi:hypothetical protein
MESNTSAQDRLLLDREEAEMGVLLTIQTPTLPIQTEAASAGSTRQAGEDTVPACRC